MGTAASVVFSSRRARDNALPAPYIVPVPTILQRPGLRPLSYDGALELFSRPLMQQYRIQWFFGAEQHGQDGVTYNLRFEGYQDAQHAWRYPDLTRHVSYLADVLDLTIEQEMRSEAQYLQRHGAAGTRLKTIIEGPDPALDRIIRSVRESRGTISGKFRAQCPILERPEIADDVVRAAAEPLSFLNRFGRYDELIGGGQGWNRDFAASH